MGMQLDHPGESPLVGRAEVRDLKNSFFNSLSTVQNSSYNLRILDFSRWKGCAGEWG